MIGPYFENWKSWTNLIFDISLYRQPLPDDMPEGEEGAQDDEHGMPSENYCDFTVYISEANGKKGLVVEATSMDTEVAFNSVLCADDI